MINYIISSNDPGAMGGSKAKEDIIKFSSQAGFISIKVNPYHTNKIAKFYYTRVELAKIFKNQAEINNVILQYPIPSNYMLKKIVIALKKKIKGKLVIWIHDIQGLQSTENDHAQWEINIFNTADILVVHNEKMKLWLVEHGVTTKQIVLGIFDYDNPQPVQPEIPYNKTLCFAGNLFKSGFLSKLNIQTKIFVYGPNMPKKHSENIIPAGQFSPEELSKHLKQNFGLIWDGPDPHSCQGTFGQYLLYNNPHKTSLYISSGIPIIIWDQAALASFVLENEIGFTVSDLSEIDNKLGEITIDEYKVMKQNVVKMACKLRMGYYTHQIIEKILAC